MSDNYDSNDASGELSSHYEGHNSACETQKTLAGRIWGCYDVSYQEAKNHGNALMLETEKHIAGLYRLFWAETNNLVGCISGECCDTSLTLTKENGQKPTGYNDYNFCMGNSIYKKDYYCSGLSSSYYTTDILIQTCNSNQICQNGACLCNPNLINTSWSAWINLSCLPLDKMNQTRSRIQYDSNNCGTIQNQTRRLPAIISLLWACIHIY